MKDYLNIDNSGQTTFKISKTSRIKHLINEKQFSEALSEIERLLKENPDSSNWNLKGII